MVEITYVSSFKKFQLVLCGVLYWLSSYGSLAKNSAPHCFCLPMVGTLAFEPRYLLLDCRMKNGQSKKDCPFFIGGDNGARRNVKRISESFANRRKWRVYADNRHIPSHGNHLSSNSYHTKNDLKKTKSRPTTSSRIIVINNIFCITEKLSSKNLDTIYGRIRHITE